MGAGFARTTQILGFRDCMGAKVVAIASRHRDRAAEVANEFGIEHVAADWQDSSNATTSISSVLSLLPPHTWKSHSQLSNIARRCSAKTYGTECE